MNSGLDLDIDVQVQIQTKFQGVFATVALLLLLTSGYLSKRVAEELTSLISRPLQGLASASAGGKKLLLILLLLLWLLTATTRPARCLLGLRCLRCWLVLLPLFHRVGGRRARAGFVGHFSQR